MPYWADIESTKIRPPKQQDPVFMIKVLKKLLCGVVLAASSVSVSAQEDKGIQSLSFGDQPELLAPEVAFQGQLNTNDTGDALVLMFNIEEGYYLYRDRFAITPTNVNISLGETQWPKAKIYSDPYFGEQAIYRNGLEATIPLTSVSSASAVVDVTYQGCADIGVCFPPVTASFIVSDLKTPDAGSNVISNIAPGSNLTTDKGAQPSVMDKLKALSANDSGQAAGATGAAAGDLLFSNTPEVLHPTEAYRSFVETTQDGLAITWNIEPGYYLYKDKTSYSLQTDSGDNIEFAGVDREDGEDYEDEFFGKTKIFRFTTSDQMRIATGVNGSGELTVNYQGCADVGVCFPPESFTVPVSWNANTALASADSSTDSDNANIAAASSSAGGNGGGGGGTPLQLSEQDRLASQLATGSLWFNAAAFFVFGLLLAFTPCVLPMVPILSSLILGGGEKQTTGKAFSLSLLYVMGMALTYTIVGVLVGLSGYNIQAWFQDPFILSAFAALFVLFSLAMFGVYELQLPASVQTKLMSVSNKQSGGRSGSVFVMGILSALIVGPCVTAPLMGALIYIADTGNAWVGGTALFALSIGMGTPLLLIGTSAGKWMPKAGGWMSAVKVVFGFLMLAMAIWMLSRFLDNSYVVMLSAALAISAGVWALLEYTKSDNAMALRTLGSAAGVAVSVYGISLLISTLAGQPSLLKPLQAFSGARGVEGSEASQHLAFNRVKSVDDLNAAVKTANASGKMVMLDFWAEWCISCKEMEAFTFTDKQVQARLDDMVLIQADVTDNDAEDQALLKHFGLFGPPAIIFYTGSGEEIRNGRLVGFLDAEKFTTHLDAVLSTKQIASAGQ